MNSENGMRLFEEDTEFNGQTPIRRGPPNRMNDLPYREWMKFQKSFFRYVSSQTLITECVHFFTKEIWPDGNTSRTLILGTKNFQANKIASSRLIEHFPLLESLEEYIQILRELKASKKVYDFLTIDLRPFITNEEYLSIFLNDYSIEMFETIKELLSPNRYCGIIVNTEGMGGIGFPLPWSIALSARGSLKLRDEKIGLVEKKGSLVYCLFMQKEKDERPPNPIYPKDVFLSKDIQSIPGWIIPKPPPRKKNEILHPAKYPETLISNFIEIFTKPGDNVFDPMVGTGSTVLAAIRANRDGYGMDIVPEFVEIARKRVAEEKAPQLFTEFQSKSEAYIFSGDATRLDQVSELSDVEFNYVITSPPYWSMLSNPGSEGQKTRRTRNLPLVYSEDKRDLGNIQDYDEFLSQLVDVYTLLSNKLSSDGYLTVIVKNVKRNHVLFTLAWDLMAELCGVKGKYEYVGTTLWCQDDISVKPFAVGIYWVSNIFHHYCMHFRKRR